jgi:hypothetical protein
VTFSNLGAYRDLEDPGDENLNLVPFQDLSLGGGEVKGMKGMKGRGRLVPLKRGEQTLEVVHDLFHARDPYLEMEGLWRTRVGFDCEDAVSENEPVFETEMDIAWKKPRHV